MNNLTVIKFINLSNDQMVQFNVTP